MHRALAQRQFDFYAAMDHSKTATVLSVPQHLGPELFEGTASQRLCWASRFPGSPTDGLRVLVRPSVP